MCDGLSEKRYTNLFADTRNKGIREPVGKSDNCKYCNMLERTRRDARPVRPEYRLTYPRTLRLPQRIGIFNISSSVEEEKGARPVRPCMACPSCTHDEPFICGTAVSPPGPSTGAPGYPGRFPYQAWRNQRPHIPFRYRFCGQATWFRKSHAR